MTDRPPAHRWARLLAGGIALLALPGCGLGVPDGSSEQGRDISGLYGTFLSVAIVVGGITYGLILWSALRYRRRREGPPTQTRHHLPLEVLFTAVPVLIVIGLFAVTFRTERRVDRVSTEPALVVDVRGFQWQWRFDYPEYGISTVGSAGRYPTLVVPAGETIRINLTSGDVIHAFYIPEFLFKRDVIPGQPNRFDLVIPEAGRFRGACAEFCGLDHADMNFWVEALPPEEFRTWVEQQAEDQT